MIAEPGEYEMLTHTYQTTRPFLYHLTDRANLAHIRETNELCPAAFLMEAAGRFELLQHRRRCHEQVMVGKTVILLRDQAPLHKGNISFEDGYTFDSFVESLNRRVFFWPGTVRGPISYGIRHFERYQKERPIVLRLLMQSVLGSNPTSQPLYCKYNSGSPRCSYGSKSARGANTFVPAGDFAGTPSTVVEVTFQEPITLPADAEYAGRPSGPWRSLRTAAKRE